MRKASLTLTLSTLLTACVGLSAPSPEAATAAVPSPPSAAAPTDVVQLLLDLPTSVVSGTASPVSVSGVDAADWSSSDLGVALVPHPGQILGMGAGLATITASFEGQKAAAPMLVTEATLTGVRVAAPATRMSAAGTLTLTATGSYSDGSTGDLTSLVAWYSSDGSVATVTGGQVRGLGPGLVTISAATGNVLGSIELTLTE